MDTRKIEYRRKTTTRRPCKVAGKEILNIAMLGDREIIGSTPKNPVNKRDW